MDAFLAADATETSVVVVTNTVRPSFYCFVRSARAGMPAKKKKEDTPELKYRRARYPRDATTTGSHHFSSHQAITFQCAGTFSHRLAGERRHLRHFASLQVSLLTSPHHRPTLIPHRPPVGFLSESVSMRHGGTFSIFFPILHTTVVFLPRESFNFTSYLNSFAIVTDRLCMF